MRSHKAKEERFQPGDCGWLGQMRARAKQNEDHKTSMGFRNKEDISDSSAKNFSERSTAKTECCEPRKARVVRNWKHWLVGFF